MNGVFPESNTFLLGLIHQDLQDTDKVSDRINTVDCDDVAVVILLAAASAATTAERVTATLRAYAANSGGSGEVVTFENVWVEAGTTLAANTDGNPARTNYSSAQTSYTTPAADGTKQMIITIPIRSRSMPAGKPWLEVTLSGPTEARLGGVYFIRHGENTGPVRSFSLL